MARQPINLGTAPDGAGGDVARTAFGKVNDMTAELYANTTNLQNTKVDTTDPRLGDAREWIASTVTQAEAEAGTGTTRRAWTAQRVWQAIAAWWAASPMKTKLDSIAANATANATDAQLRDRATHTGTQTANTISNFGAAAIGSALAGFTVAASRNAVTAADTILGGFQKVQKYLNDLGTAAYSNVTSTSIDTTVGRVLRTGDGGWMGELPVIAGTNLDDRTLRGWRYWSSVFGHTGTPPTGVTAGMLITHGINGNYVFQEFTELIQDSGIARKWRRNCYASLPWSSWNLDLGDDTLESIVSHNIVINGSFNINQRGTPLSPTLSAGQFGYDRWKAGSAGCTYTTTYSVGSVTTINITSGSLVQLVGAGYQSPGWYTLSWTGTAAARIDNGAYSASPISVYLPATNPVSVEFGPGSVTLVQFCKGNVVTPFKHRLYTEELLACQRFYQNGLVEFCGNVSAGGTYYIRVPFQTEMRVIPTVVLTNAYNNSFPATVGTVSATMRSFTETRVASATATPGAFASSFTASAEL